MKNSKKIAKLIFIIAFLSMTNLMRAQNLSVTLNVVYHNGYAISCNSGQDGSITANVTGGTAPYTYLWTNGATTQTISNLAAGYYSVRVYDANLVEVSAEITLEEPEALSVELTAFEYNVNGTRYNISLFGACNGSITTTVNGGVAPYSYNWEPFGQTTANLSNVCRGAYIFNVIDANGCSAGRDQSMTEPERSDWTMTGNTGSNPTTNFIGTSDNQDFSFRTSNLERMLIKANGDLKVSGLSGPDYELLVTDQNGVIQKLSTLSPTVAPTPWYTTGNTISPLMQPGFIGPTNNVDFIIKTGQVGSTLAERVRVTTTGKVSIGIPPSNLPAGYKLYVADGILAEKVKVALSTTVSWVDYVFDGNYKLMSIGELKKYITKHKHLPDIPSATEIEKEGGIDLATMDVLLLKKIEEQTLYIIKLNEEIELLKSSIESLKKN